MSAPSETPHVLFEDDRWLVLHKPAWMATTSPDANEATLAQWARAHVVDAEMVHPTSRLDVGVTGVCVFALTKAVNREVLEARERGDYRRTYLALVAVTKDVAAAEPGSSGAWEASIAVHPRDPKRRVAVVPGKKARGPIVEARTEWRAIDALDEVALLALLPKTGRTHQLRVHAAAAGMPLLGDAAYGGPRRMTRADGTVVGMARPALHCARVHIALRRTRALTAHSPVPADLRDVWRALGGRDEAWELGDAIRA